MGGEVANGVVQRHQEPVGGSECVLRARGALHVTVQPDLGRVPLADRRKLRRQHRSEREEQNTVIVQGKPDTLNVIEAVLLRLDQRPAAAPSPNTYQLRVMWLVDGLQRDRVRKMPASLDDVVTELAKIDMANPSIVAQVVINTTGPFEAAGTAKLDRPCDLRISGSVQDGISAHGTEQARPKLQISIEASESLPNASNATVKMLCQLETTIKIPLKHYVVLGVTPVDSMNSAFVIQVLPMSSKSEIGAR